MIRLFSALVVLLTGTALLSAQSDRIATMEVLKENSLIQVTQFEVMGAHKIGNASDVYYKFIHPGGGVQKVAGALFSGGAEPENLQAVGKVLLPSSGKPGPYPLRWLAKEYSNGKVNLYAQPLNNAEGHQTRIATPDDIMPNDSLGVIRKMLAKTAMALPEPQKAAEPPYAQTHYKTAIGTGLGGGISTMYTMVYALNPRSEWDKGLVPKGPYSSKVVTHDKKLYANVFGSEDIKFKLTGYSPLDVYDPQSGTATVVGGIRYAKDKTKENSEYYEFRFITVDKTGQILAALPYESKEPLELDLIRAIEGNLIAPDVREVNRVAIVARGGGNKKMTGIDRQLLRIILLDSKTGQIVAQKDHRLSRGDLRLFHTRSLPGNKMELLYHYAENGKNGFQTIVIGDEGVEATRDFDINNPSSQSITFPIPGNLYLNWKELQSYPFADGGSLVLTDLVQTIAASTTTPASEKKYGTVFFKYDEKGHTIAFKGLDSNAGSMDKLTLISASEQSVSLYGLANVAENKQGISFVNLDLQSMKLITIPPAANVCLAGPQAVFDSKEDKAIVYFTQNISGKGLYVNVFKY